MSPDGDGERRSRRSPAVPVGREPEPTAPAAARDDAVALLKLAGLDAELGRLHRSLAAIPEPLGRRRDDLTALARLIEQDRSQGTAQESPQVLEARRRRLLRNQRTHADLATAFERDEAEVLAMSRELQDRAARLAEARGALLARISPPLRQRYEAAVRKGELPAVAALRDGRCPGCGRALPDASRRLLQESLRAEPCSGCLRLLYERGATEHQPSSARSRLAVPLKS